eukprot:XP_014038784.1 PREDICTED: receptor-type tyrosine-protein phosphatase O-like [Salmo salar]
MNPSVAAISALAVLSVLLLSLLVVFLLMLRQKHLQMARECGAETFVNFASFERDGKLPYNWRRSLFAFLTLLPSCLWTDYLLAFYINPWSKTALKRQKLTSSVQLDDFEAYLKDMSKDSAYKFSLQFEELKSVGLDLSHDAADLPINRPKNRYTNILPCERLADESQDVLHLNYTSWPDHGVPTVNAIDSVLKFVHIVRQQANRTKEPIVVHCSAGVGRTGTFIALDRLMQHIREHEFTDILGMVSEMRSHRLSMVQTEEQYVFIHQCVLLMWKKKTQSLASDVIYENISKS